MGPREARFPRDEEQNLHVAITLTFEFIWTARDTIMYFIYALFGVALYDI